jgi:hypothetical protein
VFATLLLDLNHRFHLLGGRVLPIARRDPTQSMLRLASCLFHEVNSASYRVSSDVQPSLEIQKLPIKMDPATTVFWPKTKLRNFFRPQSVDTIDFWNSDK